MKYQIEEKILEKFSEKITTLHDLLTERISDCFEVKGMAQERHSYIFYRKLLNEAKLLLNDNLKKL
jgi:hypothetical protein